MRTVLTAICLFTLAATGYLSLSVIILQPPRVNYPVWFTLATIVTVQGALTLSALAFGTVKAAPYLRSLTLGGGVVLAAIGGWMVRETLTGAHFEGYALVLGSALVMQGALTLATFARTSGLPAEAR